MTPETEVDTTGRSSVGERKRARLLLTIGGRTNGFGRAGGMLGGLAGKPSSIYKRSKKYNEKINYIYAFKIFLINILIPNHWTTIYRSSRCTSYYVLTINKVREIQPDFLCFFFNISNKSVMDGSPPATTQWHDERKKS